VSPLPKFLWFTLALFALVNALEALRYLLPHVPFPVEMDNFFHRRMALSLHALGGAIALLAGPLQFVPRFRESSWNRHRLLGWTYCGAVLLGWCIRSFALTAAAITLRMYLPLIFVFHWPFSTAYPAIAWLCWIPNALAFEVYLRFVPTPSGITLPANLG
jgi:Predicted membrane protein (DUF2306)